MNDFDLLTVYVPIRWCRVPDDGNLILNAHLTQFPVSVDRFVTIPRRSGG